ncbi:MAG: carbon storage regulator [Spirochaetes bacterium]|nr:MAG: carbon storage regulator [Spirochaetota bacterium]
MAGLTLSRKVGESILIRALDGSEVTVRVNEVRGNRVRLDVVACLDCEIRRIPSLKLTGDSDGDVSGSVGAGAPDSDLSGLAVGESACEVDAKRA